jgi:hypothetical protein
MTYTDVVLQDGPDFYAHLDETTVGSTTVNSGTRGGTGTVNSPGSVVPGQPAPISTGGTSWKITSSYLSYTHPTVTATQLHTFEAWLKRDLANTDASGEASLFYWNGNSRKAEFLITPGTGAWRLNMGSTSLTQRLAGTATEFIDGNWHHIAYTYDGATARIYIDGVLKSSVATALGNTNTTGSITIGPRDGANIGMFIDEPTFYVGKALAADRTAAHYTAGSTLPSIIITAPAMTLSLSASNPVVTAVDSRVNIIATAPVVTVNLTTPTVKVFPHTPIATTAAVVTLTTPSVSISTDVRPVAPAAELGITFATPQVTGTRLIYAEQDNDNAGSAGAEYLFLTLNNPNEPQVYVKFPDVTYGAGTYPTSGSMTIFNSNNVAGEVLTITVHRLTEPFDPNFNYYGTKLNYAPSELTFTTGGTFNSSYNVDITPILREWRNGAPNYGIVLVSHTPSKQHRFSSVERTGVNYHPYMTVAVGPQPDAGATTVVPAMNVTVTATSADLKIDAYVQAGAGSVSVGTVAGTVTTTKNALVQAYAVTLTLITPAVTTIIPDKIIKAGMAEVWIYVPNAQQYIQVPSLNKVTGAATVGVSGTTGHSINLQTDRTVYVTNTARMETRMVGIYSAEDDRYNAIIPTTVDADDVWLPLNETTGNIAHDVLASVPPTTPDSMNTGGILIGGPTLNVTGPELRPAMRFDGVDDWINMGEYNPYTTFGGMDVTIELSLKTTDLDGTLITGGATTRQSSSSPDTLGTAYAFSEVKLVNGNIVLFNGSSTWTVRKNVADGQWHHIVISVPAADLGADTSFSVSSGDAAFVSIDGVTQWKRFEVALDGRYLLPEAIMARGGNWYPAGPSNFLAGEISNLIFRLNYAVDESTAQSLYYEWSNTVVTKAEPAVISLSVPAPYKATGNIKRILALYGLSYGLQRTGDEITGYTRDGWGNYRSIFAGYLIQNTNGISNLDGPISYDSNMTRMRYHTVKPFRLEGYMVYPMAIMKQAGSEGPYSADGLENGEYLDPNTRLYMDDRTGLPRFVDLKKDLAQEIGGFDVLTVVNYPAVRPDDGPENNGQNADSLREPRQHNMGLSNSQWAAARDALRDSIMEAAYEEGVSLWMNEPEFAVHCGFANGYDKHETDARVEFYGPGNIDATGYTNRGAYITDAAHLVHDGFGKPMGAREPARGVGQYNYTWQANAKRRIVSTEPGLTDAPAWEIGDRVSWRSDNQWEPYGNYFAHDALDRMSGLRVGDLLGMDMWEQNDYEGNYPVDQLWAVGDPRKYIVSLRPDGIVGKPISKEMETFYGPNGVIRTNRWKNNVYTVVAERGTVVRGRPISGRAFIELMDPDISRIKIAIDRNPGLWNGTPNRNVSSWSFDSRRYKEVILVFITQKVRVAGNISTNINSEERYVETQDPDLIFKPYMSMNARGLNWLKQTDDLPAGAVRVFVPAAEITLSGTDVKVSKTRNLNIGVTGAGQVYMEARQPSNFRDGNITETATPAVLTIELRGIGKSIKFDPIVIDLETPDVRAVGDGERIYVYMDAGRNVTLYMKED